ncbi:hypothetical protein [Bernardetia sp.]|uniref:hypothetical protein n=1 Tax=Bernardetia sp. TaxID=1937974 RepID=UPI0025C34D4C|nr:hypothetical protein [Bernardetia sp.]
MHIHKIDKQTHHNFLEEERKDPITGDLIEIGSEVVFCARCKSAFLKESWNYIKREHCGQKNTLKKFPKSKTLLLNIALIQPNFITLVGIAISPQACLKLFFDFEPTEKKVDVNLASAFQYGTIQYNKLMKIASSITKLENTTEKKLDNKIDWTDVVFQSGIFTFILLFATVLPLSFILETIEAKIFVVLGYIVTTFVFALSQQYKKIKKKKLILKNNEKEDSSVTFGIFNHDLFLYFEKHNVAVFLDIKKIKEFELEYETDNFTYLHLKSKNRSHKSISIPLIFSKKERITTFLLRLVKAKDDVKNASKIVIKEFPADQVRLLKRKFIAFNKFVFIEKIFS